MATDNTGPARRPTPRGGVIFSQGFRPFFGAAALLAVIAIAIWSMWLRGMTLIAPANGMTLWHLHEMVFGYGSAVLTGFLLTAIPNWTRRLPVAGVPLIALFLIWLAGRLAMAALGDPVIAAVIDAAFLPVLGLLAAREIIAGKNWRNLMVLGPVTVLALANILFHVEATRDGVSEYGVRLGLAALTFLIMLIGGRIVPSFTRNWLAQRGSARLPQPINRYDGACLAVGLVALLAWVVSPYGVVTAAVLALAAVMHAVRLARWAGMATIGNPLLAVLHVAYAMIPASLLLLALAAGLDDRQIAIAGIHLLGVGAVGGMTMSVMTRASFGHTGRALLADEWVKAALAALFGAALVRVIAALLPTAAWLIDLSALLWIIAFVLFLRRIGPWLVSPRLTGK